MHSSAWCTLCCHHIYCGRLPTPSGTTCGRISWGPSRGRSHPTLFFVVLHSHSAALAFIFITRRFRQSLSLIDLRVRLHVPTTLSSCGHDAGKHPRSCCSTEILTHAPTARRFPAEPTQTTRTVWGCQADRFHRLVKLTKESCSHCILS